jgi:two-component system, cell cycle response regulator
MAVIRACSLLPTYLMTFFLPRELTMERDTLAGDPDRPYPPRAVDTLTAEQPALPSWVGKRPRDHALLFVLAGPQQGAVFPLHVASAFIGRGPGVEVNLSDGTVSERHARLIRGPGGIYVQDGKSKNGTFLNDEPVAKRVRLVDGDHLRIGNTILRFLMLDDLEERALTGLFELAVRDPLTRVYNRRYLMAHLRSELAFAVRGGLPVALLFIDIDHFKRVNDQYGHGAGDALLELVCSSIQLVLRPYDVLCRYGGEEFVVVARDTSLANAEILAERVRSHIEALRFDVEGGAASVTVSIGVASFCPGVADCEPAPLLEAVDKALYAAKLGGRNRISASPGPVPYHHAQAL